MKTAQARLGEGIYTAADAARILNIPYPKAIYWFRNYAKNKLTESLQYKYFFQVNNSIAVNFLSLIEMNVFYILKEKGIKTRAVLEAHSNMAKVLNSPYPFATKNLYIDGGKILFGDPSDLTTADKRLQKVIVQFVIPFLTKVDFRNDGLAKRFYPCGEKSSVLVDPENQFGQPVISGTNVLVETIMSLHRGGEKNKTIAKLYDLTMKNIKDAIVFSHAA